MATDANNFFVLEFVLDYSSSPSAAGSRSSGSHDPTTKSCGGHDISCRGPSDPLRPMLIPAGNHRHTLPNCRGLRQISPRIVGLAPAVQLPITTLCSRSGTVAVRPARLRLTEIQLEASDSIRTLNLRGISAVHGAISVMQRAMFRLTDQNLKDIRSGANKKRKTNV